MWTVFERQQIIDRLATEHGQDYVLPVRLDGCQVDVPGLSKGIGYLSVTSTQAQLVADTFLKKLGQPGYEIDSTEAYARALRMIDKRRQGYLAYDKIFTSIKIIHETFAAVAGAGEVNLHAFEGHQFYWERDQGGPLRLLAKNYNITEMTEICKFEAPDAWIGCGRWRIMWPKTSAGEKGFEDNPDTLLMLFLFSNKINDMPNLSEVEGSTAFFLAALHLAGQNAENFYSIAEERYDDLR
jgi:hypothetical protein